MTDYFDNLEANLARIILPHGVTSRELVKAVADEVKAQYIAATTAPAAPDEPEQPAAQPVYDDEPKVTPETAKPTASAKKPAKRLGKK